MGGKKVSQLLEINVMQIAHDRLNCPWQTQGIAIAVKCRLIHVKIITKSEAEARAVRFSCSAIMHASRLTM